MGSDQMSPTSLETPSSAEIWDHSSPGLFDGYDRNDGPVAEVYQAGFSNMVQQLSESHCRVERLERENQAMKEDKLRQEYENHASVTRLKDHIRTLEYKAELDLEELKRRQSQIEVDVPSLEEQIKSLKYVLHDLNVSETLYSELVAIPKESRTIREHILVLAYEKTIKFHNDLQSMRQERDTSREALSRANDEVQKLRREMQRIAANDSFEKQTKDKEIEAFALRNEQLETKLQNLNSDLQAFCAKGSSHDELRCKLAQLEETLLVKEKEVAEALKALQNISKEKADWEKALYDKQHCIEVLQLEKAYSNGQYRTLEEQLHRLESEKTAQLERIHELEESQKCLFEHALSGKATAEASREQLLHVEKLQHQERNKQEMDMMRSQISEAAEFEVQMLRKTRDLAVSECDKMQAALQESRAKNEQLIERLNELTCENTKGMWENDSVWQKEAEFRKMHEQSYHELCQAKIENKILTDKVESYAQNHLKLENEHAKALMELKLKSEGLLQYQTQEQLFNEALMSSWKVLVGVNSEEIFGGERCAFSMQEILGILSTFVRRYKMLQDDLNLSETTRESLKQQLVDAEEKTESMIQKLTCMDEGKISLVDRIHQKEKNLKEALQKNEALKNKLREALLEKNRANSNLCNLQNDLRRVLEARGNIESLKKILIEKDPCLGNAFFKTLDTIKHSPRTPYGPIGL